jgi:hypothetical protein
MALSAATRKFRTTIYGTRSALKIGVHRILDLDRAHSRQPLEKGEIGADGEMLALGRKDDRAHIAISGKRRKSIANLAQHFG